MHSDDLLFHARRMIKGGDLTGARGMVNSGADPQELLEDAVIQEEPQMVRDAVSLGANPSRSFESGVAPVVSVLHRMDAGHASPGLLETFDELIESGVSPNEDHAGGITPTIFIVCSTRIPAAMRLHMLETVRKHGADLDMVLGDEGPLVHVAAAESDVAMIERLAELGLDLQAKWKDGTTPVSRARAAGNDEVVDYLESRLSEQALNAHGPKVVSSVEVGSL